MPHFRNCFPRPCTIVSHTNFKESVDVVGLVDEVSDIDGREIAASYNYGRCKHNHVYLLKCVFKQKFTVSNTTERFNKFKEKLAYNHKQMLWIFN